MKAVQVHAFGGPESLRLEEIARPTLGDDQVLVSIRAAGVNPVDAYIRSGSYRIRPALPYTPGEDGAGIVAAVGDRVTSFAPGDRVYVNGSVSGTYAELAVCLERHLYPLPARLSFAQGAAIGVGYVTAYRGLFRIARARQGESVLVHGASGGVGLAAVQLARRAGLRVFATAGSPTGRERVLAEGAHHALDHNSPETSQEILDLTDGRGVDVILEMLASRNLARDLEMAAERTRIVLVGSRGRIEIDPREIMTREVVISGMLYWKTDPAEMAIIHAAIGALLEVGGLTPVVGCELPLADARLAHEQLLEPRMPGRIVLVTDAAGREED
jgi:NADPH2:quinone reductase